ncbi:type II toxin-antitoxin system RelE/ParE family toxin [Streptomyces sp. NPDC090085]|uniref:type II toxin-antitoxin system RelE family toxin n=1 Tax=Streptomyces sp. NPDC090085 TaxID=3365943 RepID=UPI003828DDCC
MGLVLSPAAAKALQRLERSDRPRARLLRGVLADIERDPTGPGCHRLAAETRDEWSVRCGKHRVVYRLRDRWVRVEAIALRSVAYRRKN